MMVKEKKEYYGLNEAADYIGKSRASLYIYMNRLHIHARPFEGINKKRVFLTHAQVERIKEAIHDPWREEVTQGE